MRSNRWYSIIDVTKWTATTHSRRLTLLWMWHRPDCARVDICEPPPPPGSLKTRWNIEQRAHAQGDIWFSIENRIQPTDWIKLRTLLWPVPYTFADVVRFQQYRKKPEDSLQPLLFAGFPLYKTVKQSADVSQQWCRAKGRIRHEPFDSCPLDLGVRMGPPTLESP